MRKVNKKERSSQTCVSDDLFLVLGRMLFKGKLQSLFSEPFVESLASTLIVAKTWDAIVQI